MRVTENSMVAMNVVESIIMTEDAAMTLLKGDGTFHTPPPLPPDRPSFLASGADRFEKSTVYVITI